MHSPMSDVTITTSAETTMPDAVKVRRFPRRNEPSAKDEFLSTTELVEEMLSYLPFDDLLVFRRVSSSFHDVIETSPSLRSVILPPVLDPLAGTRFEVRRGVPIFLKEVPDILSRAETLGLVGVRYSASLIVPNEHFLRVDHICRRTVLVPKKPFWQYRRESSCSKILLTNPPCEKAFVCFWTGTEYHQMYVQDLKGITIGTMINWARSLPGPIQVSYLAPRSNGIPYIHATRDCFDHVQKYGWEIEADWTSLLGDVWHILVQHLDDRDARSLALTCHRLKGAKALADEMFVDSEDEDEDEDEDMKDEDMKDEDMKDEDMKDEDMKDEDESMEDEDEDMEE